MAIGTVQRAFQLAPECTSIDHVRRKLKQEGYSAVDEHVQGSLTTDLKKLLKQR